MHHPVTTEVDNTQEEANQLVDALIDSHKNYVVIYPNNDLGSKLILKAYKRLEGNSRFKIFPSIRFEYFLTLLKNSEFIRKLAVLKYHSSLFWCLQYGHYSEDCDIFR